MTRYETLLMRNLRPGDRVRLVRVHALMRPSLREHLLEEGTVEQVITTDSVLASGSALSRAVLERMLPKVVVCFDRSDCCYGRYDIRPRYLSPALAKESK